MFIHIGWDEVAASTNAYCFGGLDAIIHIHDPGNIHGYCRIQEELGNESEEEHAFLFAFSYRRQGCIHGQRHSGLSSHGGGEAIGGSLTSFSIVRTRNSPCQGVDLASRPRYGARRTGLT